MPNYNHVTLVGHITRDIEVRFIQSGTAVADIGLAVNDRVKKGNEWVDEVSFFDITLWGKTAENAAKFCKKGDPLLVDGKLKQESWEKDGQKRSKIKVIGNEIQFLGGKSGGSGQSSSRNDTPIQRNDNPRVANTTDEDDAPF